MLNCHKMLPGEPDGSVEEAIVFCAKQNYQKLLKEGYQYAVLDEDECVYVKGGDYISMLEDYGLVFSE